ncbi:MAG: phosphoribosylformylglycinamidine synthase subunit PurS [Bacteroidales bacterium]|nr:phosphoribosylformylglycinamidine synthase subunit PurS [Bacteroidales bacterium]HNV96242.1 phosphoribosylformylglycinamidine synthase subunit PurS [Bacteroidales bacterium]HOU98375.1 phosphoribosylformylglycinamidine synthase subunit PurS [Bacteroidales bacterium]
MTKFEAHIDVMPLKALLDPQGKAVMLGLYNLSFKSVKNVRVGKHIFIELEAETKAEAEKMVDEMCQKMLINPVVEYYQFTVNEA